MRSAAAAYRTDMSGRSEPFGNADGAWIAVAELVQQAAASEQAESQHILRDAIELSETVREEAGRTPYYLAETGDGARSHSEVIVALVADMEHAGALRLGSMLLEGLCAADRSLSVVEQGRILTLLARIVRKQGEIERSQVIYERVARLGRSAAEPELIARAANGLAAIMQLRGDYPAARRWATRASRLARRHGYADIDQTAQHGLMVAAARARDFDSALIHGWAAYKLSVGNALMMDDLLTNLGQLLLDTGEPECARAAFSSVLSRVQPVRIGLAALGGLAGAVARLGDRDTLAWVTREVMRHSAEPSQPFQVAEALTECADALYSIGEMAEAERFSASALRLAERFGYHDVQARAAALAGKPIHREPIPLAPRARRVVREIQLLDPGQLPERVTFAAVA